MHFFYESMKLLILPRDGHTQLLNPQVNEQTKNVSACYKEVSFQPQSLFCEVKRKTHISKCFHQCRWIGLYDELCRVSQCLEAGCNKQGRINDGKPAGQMLPEADLAHSDTYICKKIKMSFWWVLCTAVLQVLVQCFENYALIL